MSTPPLILVTHQMELGAAPSPRNPPQSLSAHALGTKVYRLHSQPPVGLGVSHSGAVSDATSPLWGDVSAVPREPTGVTGHTP